jgi:hypothetical protein
MNPRGSKHVGEIRNQKLIEKSVHVAGLCCITVLSVVLRLFEEKYLGKQESR